MGSSVCYIGVDRMTPRKPSRLNVILRTLLRVDGAPDRKVLIGNISTGGCMARLGEDLPIGRDVLLMVPGIGWTLTQVRWSLGGRFGGSFVDPIPMQAFWRANPPFDPEDRRLPRKPH